MERYRRIKARTTTLGVRRFHIASEEAAGESARTVLDALCVVS